MTYAKLLFTYWLKRRLKELLILILPTALLTLVPMFFTNIIFGKNFTYTEVWKWTYLVCFGILFLDSLRYIWARWKIDHYLADKWYTTPEAVFDADINLKMFKGTPYGEVEKKYGRKSFAEEYQLRKSARNWVKRVLK